MSKRIFTIAVIAVVSLPSLVVVGGCASGKPYSLTGQPTAAPTSGEANRRADEQRNANFRRAISTNVPPSYPS